jgi:hypothetical protein
MRGAAATLVLVLAMGGCDEQQQKAARHSFTAEGVSLEAPVGWHGRAMGLPVRGARPKAFVQIANFSLAQPPPKSLGPDQAVATLTEDYGLIAHDIPIASARSPLSRSEFLPSSSPRVPVGQALAARAFSNTGRNFRLAVHFGSRPGKKLLGQADDVLASLHVKPSPAVASRSFATPVARLRTCHGRVARSRRLRVARMSCDEALPLLAKFVPHSGEVVERLDGYTCYSVLMPRRVIRAACVSGTRVFRFNFY